MRSGGWLTQQQRAIAVDFPVRSVVSIRRGNEGVEHPADAHGLVPLPDDFGLARLPRAANSLSRSLHVGRRCRNR
jgi:hypothetical protein